MASQLSVNPTPDAEQIYVRLQEEPLDAAHAAAFLAHPRAGTVDLFLGNTRGWTGSVETVSLSYDAYVPMAVREMERLAQEAVQRWPVLRVYLAHRIGVVPAGETSVLIGVSTPHRAEAFEACRWLIDTLKRDVPIWKREHYRDGRTEWIEGSAPHTS